MHSGLVVDADPTGTSLIRARFRAAADQRWRDLARTLRAALTEHDLLGQRGLGKLAGDDKLTAFRSWLRAELAHRVEGFGGGWMNPFLEQASSKALARAAGQGGGAADPARLAQVKALAVSELQGITSVAQQQLARVVAQCLMAGARPVQTANATAAVIQRMRARTRAMVEYLAARTHAAMTLSSFRAGGITHVGITPERVRKRGLGDAVGPGARSRKRVPSKRTVRRIKAVSKKLKRKLGSFVEVVTAGDDDVCPRCEEIADNGPYTLAQAEGLIPAHNYCRCAFTSAGKYKDFDPNQARDPHGRWTSGAGYEFVSPAIGQGGGLPEALAGLKSNRQRILHEASEDIDAQLGVTASRANAVGAWSDGAENSIVTTVKSDADWDKLRVAAAMEGHIADQKAVLVFKQQDGGASALYSFHTGETDIGKLHDNLLADGLAFHTIAPYPDGARVYVADLDGTAHDAVARAAERYDAGVDYQRGRAEFVGTTKQDGTDREQRDDARRAYEKVIEQSTVPRGQEIWARVHHHWGQALGVVTDAFNPDEPRDPHGRWTSSGGFSDDAHRTAIAGLLGRDFQLDEDIPRFAGLSLGERNTIAEYSDSTAFHGVNAALRSDTATAAQQDFADKLDSALDKVPDFEATTYRVGSNSPAVLRTYQDAVGRTVREKSFLSTGRSESSYLGDRRLVNFIVEGRTGKDISRISKVRDEREVLFRSGTKFKVMSVKAADDGKYDVVLSERNS